MHTVSFYVYPTLLPRTIYIQSHSMFNPFTTFIVWGRGRVIVILYDHFIQHIWKNVTIIFLLLTTLIFIAVVRLHCQSSSPLSAGYLPSSLFYFIFVAVQLPTKLYVSREEVEKTATFHLADWTLSVAAIEKKKKQCGTKLANVALSKWT